MWTRFACWTAVVFSAAPPSPCFGGGAPPAVRPEQLEFFEKRIRPLLANHCYSCHSRDAKKVRGSLYLDTAEGVRRGGASGPAVVPGQPAKSLLIQAVHHDPGADLRMPPKGRLSSAEIADLVAWVKMGAPDPRTGPATPKRAGIDVAKEKKFWSLRPLSEPALPAVKQSSWPANVVDRFVLAKLEEKGLTPSSAAEPHTLLRRMSYDLVGLPPTPEELQEFVVAWDVDRGKRQALIAAALERLLASPAYGERWGRYWLDVVRYADTAGDNSDYPIPQMIKYRDWVIDAFNRDMPYDQFVRDQLAGDLLAPLSHLGRGAGGEGRSLDEERRAKIIATGYLANSRRHGSYEDARYPWHLTIEDTIDNFGRAFLGINLGCCRCHDHKFDPFSAEDYYALYGFFSSTRYPWPGIELDRAPRDLVPLASAEEIERVMQPRKLKLAEFDARIEKLEREKASTETIRAARREREKYAQQPLPFDNAYAMMDGPAGPKQRIGQVGDVRVQLKGDPDHPGKEVPRRFPLVLGGHALGKEVKGSGRLQLAQWLTSPDNPLFARVMVNRIWHYHFGRGIVNTPNDFGKQGASPTHPELLDYLARRFIDSGWSVKEMHRLVVLSATYRQVSGVRDQATSPKANNVSLGDPQSIDPDNDYLWRFARRRLDAEAIRDTILAVSGSLDRSRGTAHPFPDQAKWDFTQHKPFKAVYDMKRRSVYLMTQRIQRHPFLALFDGPDTNASTALRTTSTTPLQALFLMNDPFVHEQARRFAARLMAERGDDATRIERAFQLAFGRPPRAEERAEAAQFLDDVRAVFRTEGVAGAEAPVRAWESLARAILMSNELVYVN